MKKQQLLVIVITVLSLFTRSIDSNAQTLFKDLHPGAGHSQPEQFINVNGTLYFTTNGLSTGGYWRGIWKSDGTAAGTVPVKDSIISTAIGAISLRSNVNGELFYTVNKSGPTAGDTTRLWKTGGSAPVLVTTLIHPGGYAPQNFTVVGTKLFFSMNINELWVSDGTAGGTMRVGSTVKVQGGLFAFNGKIYFAGSTGLVYDLYSSDGTAAGTTLVKAGTSNPGVFILYKNELYFGASGIELWKTDGTPAGTVKITDTKFTTATLFKNELYYAPSGSLWKTDGTAGGTMLMIDSAGAISGATSDFLFTKYLKPPTYNSYYCWKSDGTIAGTVRVSDSLGIHASFAVLNNKMYSGIRLIGATVIKGFWETDGTEAGTKKFLPTSSAGEPFIFNNTVFFQNTDAPNGSELWWYTTGSTGISPSLADEPALSIYPNPSSGNFQIKFDQIQQGETTVEIYNYSGEKVYRATTMEQLYEVNLTGLAKGIYFVKIEAGEKVFSRKLVVE